MSEVIRSTTIEDDKIVERVTQDVEPILEINRAQRNATPETGKYRGNLVHAARIPLVFIETMRNGQCCAHGTTYNLMSPDMEERRRALVHLQSEHKDVLTISGKPFAKQRPKWR